MIYAHICTCRLPQPPTQVQSHNQWRRKMFWDRGDGRIVSAQSAGENVFNVKKQLS